MKLLRESFDGGTLAEAPAKSIEFLPSALHDSGLTIQLKSVPVKIVMLHRGESKSLQVKAKPADRFTIVKRNPIPGADDEVIGTLSLEPDPGSGGGVLATWKWTAEPSTILLRGNHIGLVMAHGDGATTHVLYSPVSLDSAIEQECRADIPVVSLVVDKSWFPLLFGRKRNEQFSQSEKLSNNVETYVGTIANRQFSISRTVGATIWQIDWKSAKESEAISMFNKWIRSHESTIAELKKQHVRLEELVGVSKSRQEEADKQSGRRKERTLEDKKDFDDKADLIRNDIKKSVKLRDELVASIQSNRPVVSNHEKSFSERMDQIHEIIFADMYLVPVAVVKLKVE